MDKYLGNQDWRGCDHGGGGSATGKADPGHLFSLKAPTYMQRLKSGDPQADLPANQWAEETEVCISARKEASS